MPHMRCQKTFEARTLSHQALEQLRWSAVQRIDGGKSRVRGSRPGAQPADDLPVADGHHTGGADALALMKEVTNRFRIDVVASQYIRLFESSRGDDRQFRSSLLPRQGLQYQVAPFSHGLCQPGYIRETTASSGSVIQPP